MTQQVVAELGEPPISRNPLQHRSISIVIPAYNEEGRLPATLEKIHRFLVDGNYDGEIIVVDDGSKDQTYAGILSLQKRIPMLRGLTYLPNKGKGFAVRAGILAATREAILFSDADLSTSIGNVDLFWKLLDDHYDVVVASRYLELSRIIVQQPLHRRMLARSMHRILALLGVRGFRDTQCGFKLFKRAAALDIFSKVRCRGFAFDVEVLLRARRGGYRIAEVPVEWTDSAESKVNPVRDSIRMLLEILRIQGIV